MSQKSRVKSVKKEVEAIISRNDFPTMEGDFKYSQDGFAIKSTLPGKFYKWNEIVEIIAYKVDLMTIDDVRLDISFADFYISVSEDSSGWPLFIERLMYALPGMNMEWERKVVDIPFAANATIIYKRN